MLIAHHHRLLAFAFSSALVTAIASCSDDTPTPAGGSTDDDAGGAADAAPDVPVIITNDKESKHSGKIIRAQTTDEGVPEATVTIAGKSVVTNASGDYEIVVPRNTPYSMTVSAVGFYKLLDQELILKNETLTRGSTVLLPTATADFLAGLLPGRKPEKGFLVVRVNARPPCASEDGSTLTIDPPGEAKLAYFNGSLPQSSLTAVKAGGDFSAAFYNVEPGVPVKVTVTSPSCKQVAFPTEVGDGTSVVTYTGNQITEAGEALAYLRLYIQDPI